MERQQGNPLSSARQEITEAVNALALAIRTLIEDTCWKPPILSPTDLERRTSLSHKVAWQLYRVGTAEDPLTESENFPKRTAFTQFLRDATKAGVPGKHVKRAQSTFEAFDASVKRIAGDRDTLAEMVASWRGIRFSTAAAGHCRQAFRANKQIWGVSAKASFMSVIFPPDNEHESILIRGLCSLRSSRRSTWDIYGSSPGEGGEHNQFEIAASDGTNLISKYCRGPIPQLSGRTSGNWRVVAAEFEASGEVSPHTLVFGERLREQERRLEGALMTSFPTERLQLDLICHRSYEPTLKQHSLFSGHVMGSQKMHSVPIEVTEQEGVLGGAGFREMSSYPDLLEEAILTTGHAARDYILFRAACLYPPTGVTLEMDLNSD